MDRRSFLATTATSAAMFPFRKVFGNNPDAMREMLTLEPGREVLQKLENNFLKICIYNDASMEITDKQRQQNWLSGPVAMQEEGLIDEGYVFNRTDRSICEQYPGRFSGTKEGDNIRFILIGRQKEKMGEFVVNYQLEKDEMLVKILDIDDKIPSLFFPPPLFSESIILPERTGRKYNAPGSYWTRTIYKLHQHISMRWFGGLNGQNGWICILEGGWADSVLMKMCLTISAGWLKSLGQWTPRSLRYCFTENGYVGQAKRFRQWAKDNDLFHPLTEKQKQLPHLDKIIGGRIVGLYLGDSKRRKSDFENLLVDDRDVIDKHLNTVHVHNSFADAIKIKEKYKQAGFKKGVFNYQGWLNGGYDHSHPDVWPPDPALGSLDEFKELLTEKGDFITSIHDNYLDIYDDTPSFPKGVIVRPNGRLMTGGIWSHRQCYILNSRNSLAYLKRNWKHYKSLGIKSMYIDTLTTMELYQSFEKGNTQTREQDFYQRRELAKFVYDKGIAMGSENISEISVMYTAYGSIHSPGERVQGENIPLFQLVFGDCTLLNMGREFFGPTKNSSKQFIDRQLTTIANGGFMIFGCWQRKWNETLLKNFKNSFHVDQWHGKIATSELINHQFLDENDKVEELEYANGHKAIVNFGDKDFFYNNKKIKAFDYLTI